MGKQLDRNRTTQTFERLEGREMMTADGIPALTDHVLDDILLESHSDQVFGYGSDDVDFAHNELGLSGVGQTVVIIDSGIAYDHVALGGGYGENYRVVGGYDFAEDDANPYDDAPEGFHGTHVAGIVGSDDPQYTGVAPGVDLVALRVFDDNGGGSFRWVESALDWVHDNKDSFEHTITTVNLSLGAAYNGNEIPNWAMLEDEFAQLERDGIFISVSAGNSFSTYDVAGLSYPAVSQYVVPVASAGASGLLSGFSQRNERVIVAPGELITSTAPDFVHGADGVKNDFSRASGTSMAAPYAAGASVLIREALEIAGHVDITQDDIYEHMLATSDQVFDPLTQASYSRLNLERALTAALPTDDFGNTAADALNIGTLSGMSTVDGIFTATDDVDFFTFTAGLSGSVSIDVSDTHYADTALQLVGGPMTGDNLQFEVVAEQSYTVSLATNEGIGSFRAELNLTSNQVASEELGAIDALAITDAVTNTNYRFSAAHSAELTITAAGSTTGQLQLLDSDGNQIASRSFVDGNASLQTTAVEGASYAVRFVGTDAPTNVRVTNLVAINNGQIDLFGTAGNDRFVVQAGSTVTVTVNDETYTAQSQYLTSVELHDGDAADELLVFGTDGDDAAIIEHNQATILGADYLLQLDGSARYSLVGNAGNDAVTIFDTAGNDVFTSRKQYALLTGSGLRHVASGFEVVTAHSVNGGNDLALFHDSADDNSFELRTDSATMKHEGVEATAIGFGKMQGFAGEGGDDTATVVGSVGNDRVIARPDTTYLEQGGQRHLARGFESVEVDGSAGGQDVVLIYDSAGDDQLTITGDNAELRGTFFTLRLHAFDAMTAIANGGGDDSVVFQDTAGDDRFIGLDNVSILQGEDYRHVALDFEDVTAIATHGNDQAVLYTNPDGSDVLEGNSTLSRLSGKSKITTVAGFDDLVIIGETAQEPIGQGALDPDPATREIAYAPLSFVEFATGDSALKSRVQSDSEANKSVHAESVADDVSVVATEAPLPSHQADRALEDESLTKRRHRHIEQIAQGAHEHDADRLASLAFETI